MQRTVITPFSRIWGFGAPVTIILIAINSAIWLFMVITSSFGWLPLETFWYHWFAMTPERVLQGHIYQMLTSVFLHDGMGILHVLINMYLLWMFGPRIERTMGSKLYLIFFLVTGISGSLLSLMMRAIGGDTDIASLGASSAVFGVLVAYGFMFKNDLLLLFFIIPIRAWIFVLAFIGLESLFIVLRMMESVDHWGHLGGAAASAIWMWVLTSLKGAKTEHGWYKSGTGGIRTGKFYPGRQVRSGRFRIIINKPENMRDDHPEGTDDEPPPDWFKY